MIKVNSGGSVKAEDDSLLVQIDFANVPIPNGRLPLGIYYSFKNSWHSIIDILTPSIKNIITNTVSGTTWGEITGTLSNQKDLQSALDLLTPKYLSYQAIINQTSTDAPVEDRFDSNFSGITFTWDYVGIGEYTLTTDAPVFTIGKCVVQFSTELDALNKFIATIDSDTIVTVKTNVLSVVSSVLTSTPTDGLLNNTLIEIKIFQ